LGLACGDDVLLASDQMIDLPHRFDEARGLFIDLFRRGDHARIPRQTMLAAAMVEVVPRLVSLYGGAGAAAILVKLADQVSVDDGAPVITQ
jgi:glycogen debranching enzyme